MIVLEMVRKVIRIELGISIELEIGNCLLVVHDIYMKAIIFQFEWTDYFLLQLHQNH